MITKLLDGLTSRRRGRRAAVPAASPPLVIEYSPRLDGDGDPGEVVWGWVPFEDDPSQGKDRPMVVIGRAEASLIAIALTTKDHGPLDERLAVGTGDWDPQRRQSFAKINRLIAIDPANVRREGAVFPRRRFDALVAAVRSRNLSVEVGGVRS